MTIPTAAQATQLVTIGGQLVTTGNAILAALGTPPPLPPAVSGSSIPPASQIVVPSGVAQGTWTLVNGKPRLNGQPTYADPGATRIAFDGTSLIIKTVYDGAWWVYVPGPRFWDNWHGAIPA